MEFEICQEGSHREDANEPWGFNSIDRQTDKSLNHAHFELPVDTTLIFSAT